MQGFVGVAPGTTTLQTESGEVIQIVNWVDDKHYGTCQWQTGDTASISVFSAALSQPIPGGTRPLFRTDVNLPRSGDNGLPTSWEQYIYAISVRYRRSCRAAGSEPVLTDYSLPCDNPTIFDLNRKIYWELKYNGKVYSEGIGEDYPAGAGNFWQGSQSQREVVNNGVPSPRDRAAMVLPVWMREGLRYAMTGYPEAALSIAQVDPAGGAVLTFVDTTVSLHGLIKRNV